MTVDRRPMGSGSIEERGGRFRVRLRLAGRKETLGTYATRGEAEAVLEAAFSKLEADQAAPANAVTLRAWVARWLPAREQSRAVRDASHDGDRMRAYVLTERWADDPIDTVNTRTIRAWTLGLFKRKKRNGETLSRSTIVAVVSTLRVCYRDAIDEGLLDANPCDGVKVPSGADAEDEPWTYLTLDEIERLLTEPRIPEHARLLYTVAIYTGLRKGELWGLRWRDVQLEHVSPHVMVRRSRSGPTKTGKHRAVPLLPAAADALRRLRELDATAAADALVFAWEGGMRARSTHGGWRSRWKVEGGRRRWQVGHRELAGIERPVRFHDLRHTCASHLRMGSWTERPMELGDIQAWLGHSSAAMSLRYAHLAPDYLLGRVGPKLAPGSPRTVENIDNLDGLRRKRITLAPACDVAELGPIGAAMGPHLERCVTAVAEAVRAGEPVERLAIELVHAVIERFTAAAATPARAQSGGTR